MRTQGGLGGELKLQELKSGPTDCGPQACGRSQKCREELAGGLGGADGPLLSPHPQHTQADRQLLRDSLFCFYCFLRERERKRKSNSGRGAEGEREHES